MEVTTIALLFILIGAIFIIIEALSPGVFMVIPGTILVILGIIGYAAPDFLISWYSPILAVVIAVPITLVTIRAYKFLGEPIAPSTMVSESLIGKVGTVTEKVYPDSIKGKVQINSDIWSATSDEIIEKGTKVRVCSAEGVHVKLERI
ncbi:MAG: NfeD family protein [Candidatus Methanomethylophilaceae archaeon]|nr:NfeD family protein [Candidatus Methanomethylophilaceae archaeon]MDY0225059.1 NfeD family protein [Candidatus Methanomethylophilaceae archaeon]